MTGKHLGGSTTTANVWMILAGEIKDTGIIYVPKGACEFRFQVIILGFFYLLSLCKFCFYLFLLYKSIFIKQIAP